jgi:hypothetical protein
MPVRLKAKYVRPVPPPLFSQLIEKAN